MAANMATIMNAFPTCMYIKMHHNFYSSHRKSIKLVSKYVFEGKEMIYYAWKYVVLYQNELIYYGIAAVSILHREMSGDAADTTDLTGSKSEIKESEGKMNEIGTCKST